MSDLKPYKIEVNGTKSTVLLSDEDAKTRGLLKEKAAGSVANKQADSVANKQAEDPANK